MTFEPPASHSDASVVLVADSVRARLFAAPTPAAALEERASLVNVESRLHEGDLVEDATGVRNRSATKAKRSAFGGQSAKRHRAEEFAAQVAARTAELMREAHADRLYVVAEPEFLGLLRMRMDKNVRRCVAAEVPKALTSRAAQDIRAALPPRL